MRISVLGGGPGGLYFSILMKMANPAADITVVERNRPGDTFGWGVVFSDKTLGNFALADPETHAEIERNFRHWEDIDIFFRGAKITSGGHGFCGIARVKLLAILQARAEALGVKLEFQREVADPEELMAGAGLGGAAAGSSGWARRSCSMRSPSRSRKPTGAGSRCTPTGSTRRPALSSSRRPKR